MVHKRTLISLLANRFSRCYEANPEKNYLIFEDLIALGYRNPDRQIGLTVDNFKSTFSLLAKWHAATAMLMQTVCHSKKQTRNQWFQFRKISNLHTGKSHNSTIRKYVQLNIL